MKKIPFNKPFVIGHELDYIHQAVSSGHLAGDGMFTRKCNAWLEERFGAKKALLTHSCTAALEMAAILTDVGPGDEVIMPSYTFVSTANAFVLRGAIPVWCDIREDTLNLDETKIEALITPRTKVIVPVHYAGVGCEMDTIMDIARRHNLLVVEDAAQAVNASYKGRWLGTIGHLGCYSFHETKNVISGEGGALMINDERFVERAEIIREKGTDRSKFFRGEVDKYTWVDIGSSYLPSELVAAFLFAQLEHIDQINEKRLAIWRLYHESLEPLALKDRFQLQTIPTVCRHTGHLFCLLLNSASERKLLLKHMNDRGIKSIFHYIPLHSSPMEKKLELSQIILPVTESIAERIIRLPLFFNLSTAECKRIIKAVFDFWEGG